MTRWRLHPLHRPPLVSTPGARHRSARHRGADAFAHAAQNMGGWSLFSRCTRFIRYRKLHVAKTEGDGERLLDAGRAVDRDVAVDEVDGKQEGLLNGILIQVGRACCAGTLSL